MHIEVLRHTPVTLVLTDLRMPQMDGIELLRQVRLQYPDTAVVLITAVADVDIAVSCLAIGAMDYLMKPFNLDEVRARVAQALEKAPALGREPRLPGTPRGTRPSSSTPPGRIIPGDDAVVCRSARSEGHRY